MSIRYPAVAQTRELSRARFYADFAGRRPVVLRGVLCRLRAVDHWDLAFLERTAGAAEVKVKRDSSRAPTVVETMTLTRFKGLVEAHRRRVAGSGSETAPYLHDTPLIVRRPELLGDLEGFPVDYLPRWYRRHWWRFALFFVGAPGSLTPLHFDTLRTHNLFFQLSGHKRFVIVPPPRGAVCYRRGWRWSDVDAENPDLRRHPRFAEAEPAECTLAPGDGLYIPPGAFHQVRGLDATVSFNLDWHTPASALSGVASLARGMPARYAFCNAVHALGLCSGLPATWLYPLCRRHLESVD